MRVDLNMPFDYLTALVYKSLETTALHWILSLLLVSMTQVRDCRWEGLHFTVLNCFKGCI